MESTLLFLAACLMFSGVRGGSQSMSCSTVNGKTICNKQTSDGNTAMAASQAQIGGGDSYQSTYAGAGTLGQWDSSSQTLIGGYPGGYYYPSISYDFQDLSGPSGGTPRETDNGFSPSDTPNSFDVFQARPGGFVGGGPVGGSGFVFTSSGFPNTFVGSQAGAGGAFAGGFAGGFPFFPFGYGYGYPEEDSSDDFGGAPDQGGYAGPIPAPSNPFDFVNRFMGGGFGGGAFAGAGVFPFGRR